LQEPDTSFLTDGMIKLLKKAKESKNESVGKSSVQMSLSSLLSQLVLSRAEWVKFLGGAFSTSDASALERAAMDRSTTAPALIEVVTAS
jgi:hypothetical protein